MSRKRSYTVSEVLDGLTAVGRNPKNPREVCSAALKCLAMLNDAVLLHQRNEQLRVETAHRKVELAQEKTQETASKARRRELETLIKRYQAQHDREVPLGNAKLGEMMSGWKAELAAIVAGGDITRSDGVAAER